ncbi:MAG TPA: protein kinase [Thermoanaerobaculia bacterium]|nr:protein kinase [Thermoanaerobaculia bacterium]
MIGSVVSHYRVLERLGGVDDLYKAQDLQRERLVALQLLPGGGGVDKEAARKRFAREASRASSIGDPNIGSVYEVGETDDGRVFLAMALDEGEPLSGRLAHGPLALERVMAIGTQVAAGLASAHAEGIVHGALDPTQVLVNPEGRVKVVGFGAGSLPDAAERARPYLAPERLQGGPADVRADLWSLGVLLYEMIAGRHPFPGVDAALSSDPAPLGRWRTGLPSGLERAVVRALAKRPEDRYADAGEMRAELQAVEETGVVPVPPLPSPLPRAGREGAKPGKSGGMLGRAIGHYVVKEHIGGGGMGVVYKAEDLRLERTVALKFLPPELTRDPVAKARFLQEARAASALEHPNICTIHEVDETEDGQLYLAMPAYDGETLKRKVENGPLPLEEAIGFAIQAGQGLAKAHRQGIVHRDIKPANLIVTGDAIVKILDFGLAKLAGAAGLTRAGFCLGTPSYMSPEQARGEVDQRTDLWSLGVVLYEMVTGRPPFRADTDQGIIYALLTEEPEPVRKLRPEAPPELERILKKMLAKDPAERYPNLDAVIADLRSLSGVTSTLTQVSLGGLPAQRPWWRMPALAAAGAVILVGLILLLRAGGWLGERRGGQLQVQFAALTDQEGSESSPSLKPGGDEFVYAKSTIEGTDIYLQRLGGENPLNLTPGSAEADTQPAFSPDGSRIAFRSERDGGGIFLMGATGESVRRLTDFGFNPTWSPDGKEIAVGTESISEPFQRTSRSQLWGIRVADGRKRLLSNGDAVQPSWSPHGYRIAYWGLGHNSERVIWTIPVEGGEPVRAVAEGPLNWNPVWSPDGRYLYFVSDRGGIMNLWRVAIDERSGVRREEPEAITTPSRWSGLPSIAQDGRRIAYEVRDRRFTLEAVPFDPGSGEVAGPPEPLGTRSKAVRFADVSPDGQWITFDTAVPQEDLYVTRRDGSGLLQLTNDPHRDRAPQWSPDGKRILFYSNRSGRYQAWTIQADGSGLEQLTDNDPQVLAPLWSPDGKRLAAGVDYGAAVLIDLDKPIGERTPLRLPSVGLRGETLATESWSADGRLLAGTIQANDGSDIPGVFAYSLDSGRFEKLADRGRVPAWLPDGRRLIYIDEGKAFLFDVRTRQRKELMTPAPNSSFVRVRVSPDGRTLYATRSIDEADIWMLSMQDEDAGGGPG